MKAIRNVGSYLFGPGALGRLEEVLRGDSRVPAGPVVYLVDHFFAGFRAPLDKLPQRAQDRLVFIDTTHEPSTGQVDQMAASVRQELGGLPGVIVGMGGGATLDMAKAVSNLLTNGGQASDYQGWDLVRVPGVYKIGVPTLSGTGSETSRTCVLTNYETGVKLGMNSDFSVFDQLILDPELTATVPREQYFHTGLDTYFHCMETLNGRTRNGIVDAYSEKAIDLCRQVFLQGDMQDQQSRENMMIASLMGGAAAGNTGLVHPLSAGLSVVLGTHHGLANCLAMGPLAEFYPAEHAEFLAMARAQGISLPSGLGASLSDEQIEKLYASSIVHAKPLANHLGEGFRDILTPARMAALFRAM
ncbi:MAG: iron-containing alcohol dehydrogenase [Desulfarculus sp.]|nr:iron-containing alcohol dehydrogenase [Desulfarculus sp.]